MLRELLARGFAVRALVRAGTLADGAPALPKDGRLELVTGDLRRAGDFARKVNGCRYVVHCAALYSFAARDRAGIDSVNVTGTAGLMAAAGLAGVDRVVLTSSSATVGHERPDGRPADETCYADTDGGYHGSKVKQERAAFAGRAPVVALLPTAPVGPGDWKPTPTGKLIVDFLRGRIGAKAPGRGGMNLVAVEDVARAHAVALERGHIGERYVIGGENLSMDEVWLMLAGATGKPMPSWRVPYAVALAVAYADEVRCSLRRDAVPFAPLEGVRMSRERMFADSSKAMRELDFRPTPVREAIERAVAWYRDRKPE